MSHRELEEARATAERRKTLLAAALSTIEKLTAERDAARAGLKLVFQLIDGGDLETVHDVYDCPEDDTCTCRIRRFTLMLQLAMADTGSGPAISAMSLLATLPPPGPHDRADCPCGHPLGTKGPCAGCNCADDGT